ncbi:hypothetical protein IAD21_02418 [Abditibacteriota bacterium]|nr:hypothetical protein IAD21_02418 [Abditibacteriota bacterium]
MPYAVLSAELSLNTKKFEQGLEFAETMMKGFVGPTRVVKLALDTKSLNTQLKQAEATLTRQLKAIVIPVELKMTVNGQAFVIEQSKAAEGAIRRQETATKELNAALAALETKGYGAFAGTLKGATDISAALDRAQAKLREIGTVKAPSSKWSVSLGDFNKVKEAEADLKRLGASLERDAKFTQEFSAHLQKMQGLIDSAAARGEKLGTQIANRLLAAAKNAEIANNAFALMGRGLSAVGSVATGVSGVLLGLGRSFYNFARGYILLPLMYRGFSALKEATIGYNITLERARTSLTSMMNGSEKAANALLNNLEDLAIRSQFNFDDLAGLAPQLRVAKVASEDLVPTFTAMGDAVTSASKGREGLKALSGDMVSLSMRGKVTGQDLRNFAANGVNLVTYLAQAYSGILPPNIKQAELAMRQMISKGLIPADKAIKAFVAGVENDPLRAGAMARQARTLEGAMSNIGDAIKRALGKEAFGDTFQWLTKQATKFLDIVSSQAFLDWGKAMAPKVLAVTSTVAGFFGTVINWGVKTYNVLSMAIGWLVDTWPRVQSVGAQAFKYISAATMLAVRAVGYFEVSLNPLAGLFQMATDGAHDFWDVLRGVGSLVLSIGEGISQVLVPAVWTISKPLVGLSHLVTNVFDAIPKNLISRIIGADSANDLSTLMDGLKSATTFVEDASTFGGNQKLWQGLQDSFNNGVLATEEGWKKIKDKWKSTGFDSPDFKALIKGANIFGGIDTSDFTMPQFGIGDTNQNNNNAKAQAKALQELAKLYDKVAKSAEDSATRQLNALKGVRDTLQEVLGSIQSDLAKFGVFNSSVFDQFAAALQRLTDLGGKSSDIVAKALERVQDYGKLAHNAREAAKKIGQNISGTTQGTQTTATTVGGFPVSTALQAGKVAGNALIENLVREFNDKSSRKLGASCADVAARVMAAIGQGLEYSANAGQLEANAKKAGWKPVPLGTRGSLNFQGYPGNGYYGKVSGEHVTVGLGNGRVMGSSGYKVSTQSVGSLSAHDGRPRAYMPPNGVTFRVPSFANNPMGVGNVAAVQNGDNGPQAFLQQIQELLKSLNLSKLSLPKEWGKPIRDAANQAHMFQAQMMLANENTQALLRAVLGDKFAAFVKQLREGTYAADQFLGKLKAGQAIGDELRSLAAKSRARGRENDPFFALSERQRDGGDLSLAPTLNAFQAKAMAAQATLLEAVVKANTLAKGVQGPVLPSDKIEEMKTRAADLRRTLADANAFLTLQSKVLHDALDTQTYAIKENVRALQDRKKVLETGAKFVTASTFDELGYARAIELRGKEVEYWGRAEVKALAGQASALEELAKANTLAKGAQGPVNPNVNVAGTLAAAHKIRLTLNQNAATFLSSEASAFDFEKAFGRTIDMAKTRQEMDRRLGQLQEQIGLVNSTELSVGQLNIALEKSGFFYEQIYRLQDAGYGERSTALANELSLRQQIATALERAIEAGKEWKKSVQELDITKNLSAQLRELYAKMKGGPALDRAIFEKQTQSDLKARYDSGEFDVPVNTITSGLRAMRGIITAPQIIRDPSELEKRVQQAMQGFGDKSATDRVGELNARWTQMQNDLLQKRAELERPLSELAKAQLDFKIQGKEQSAEELDLQGKILGVARQLDSLASEAWRKQQAQQLTLASIFDPSKRADQQFRFDHPEWSEEQINAMLPVDQMSRKLHEGLERMQGLMDGWRDSWSDLFRDIAKGQFTFGSFLDSITNKLLQWAADTLSSAAFQGLQGLLGQLTGAIIGARGMGSVTARVGTPDTVYGPPNTSGYVGNIGGYSLRGTSAMPQDYLMRSAQQITAGEGRRTSSLGAGDIHNWDFKGSTINVAESESLPEAAHRHIQTQNMNQPTRDSRRTISKKLQTIIGN